MPGRDLLDLVRRPDTLEGVIGRLLKQYSSLFDKFLETHLHLLRDQIMRHPLLKLVQFCFKSREIFPQDRVE